MKIFYNEKKVINKKNNQIQIFLKKSYSFKSKIT